MVGVLGGKGEPVTPLPIAFLVASPFAAPAVQPSVPPASAPAAAAPVSAPAAAAAAAAAPSVGKQSDGALQLSANNSGGPKMNRMKSSPIRKTHILFKFMSPPIAFPCVEEELESVPTSASLTRCTFPDYNSSLY